MSDSIAIGPDTAARLLVRLRLRRTLNQALGSWQILRRKPVSGEKRAATAGKAKLGWLLAGLVGLSMIFGAFNLSVQALTNMQRTLGTAEVTASVGKSTLRTKLRRALPNAPASGLPVGVLQAVALTALILLIAVTCFALGAGDLARPDWDLEWLVTLPVSLSTLLAVRLIERTFLGGGLAVLWPFLAVAAWYAGHGVAGSAGLGLLAAFPLLAIVATARTLIDTGLRLSVGPGRLRNLQSIVGLAAALLLYLALSVGISPTSYILDWAPALPAWAFWLPPGLASRVVAGTEAGAVGMAAVVLVMESAAIATVGLALLMRQLKDGVVSTGARESGRRPARARTAAEGAAAPERRLLSPIQARELTLLARDRNFLVQTLLLPVIVIGAQLWFNAGGEILSSGWTSASGLAAVAFFISAYALMFSALQTLNNEGNALWILYGVPQPLDAILWQKALLWGTVCLVYPLAVFAIALSLGRPPLQVLGHAVVVLAGVPIFAVIATALGVFASDPLQQQVQRRLRPSYMYLYMMLAGLYAYTVIASTVWQVVGLMVLTALLGLALWQKARDHLPYLLDPSASPPARVSLSDGLVAAMMFFVVQGLVAAVFALSGRPINGGIILIAFSVAGATTFLLMRFVYWRLKSQGVPCTFGTGGLVAVALGVGAGAAAGLAALVYVAVVQHMGWFEAARQSAALGPNDGLWLLALAVAAAPVFEEFIFRGLIFGGLRRTLGPAASVLASAAIFALVHAPFAVIPVFGLGIAAALVYDRTRLLIGPMAAHAVYNAIVVGYHFVS